MLQLLLIWKFRFLGFVCCVFDHNIFLQIPSSSLPQSKHLQHSSPLLKVFLDDGTIEPRVWSSNSGLLTKKLLSSSKLLIPFDIKYPTGPTIIIMTWVHFQQFFSILANIGQVEPFRLVRGTARLRSGSNRKNYKNAITSVQVNQTNIFFTDWLNDQRPIKNNWLKQLFVWKISSRPITSPWPLVPPPAQDLKEN